MTQRDLYFISGSPPCWTIMLALEIKGIAYNQRRLDNSKGEQKGAAFLGINPRGNVPVLVDGTATVCETLAILAYLDAIAPAPPLFGTIPQETARIWQTICDCDSHVRGPVGDISRPLFRGKVQAFTQQITEAAAIVREELGSLEARLASSPWLVGKALSAADLVVFPVLMQLCRAVGREDTAPLDLAIHPLGEYFPALNEWRLRMENLDGFDNAYPPHWK
ncbi:MAG: glutathione S-transferase family protein [Rhodospirillaceae bacterium]|jgi:glutathione S-transferase|nr:glutathione S-transferase family protein [Rhodospirillaceae bacterium]MBT5458400.1 glutathione S-transferase family protein [Rhodospirillaceae bacterium]